VSHQHQLDVPDFFEGRSQRFKAGAANVDAKAPLLQRAGPAKMLRTSSSTSLKFYAALERTSSRLRAVSSCCCSADWTRPCAETV
jgi:hypothetical protein